MKQIDLKFDRRRLLVDTRFEKYTVNLYHGPADKVPTIVSGVWARSPKQAIVKAVKLIHGESYSMRESRAYPQKP